MMMLISSSIIIYIEIKTWNSMISWISLESRPILQGIQDLHTVVEHIVGRMNGRAIHGMGTVEVIVTAPARRQ